MGRLAERRAAPRPLAVWCPGCHRWVGLDGVTALDYGEGDQGQDRCLFRCGECGQEAWSDVRQGPRED